MTVQSIANLLIAGQKLVLPVVMATRNLNPIANICHCDHFVVFSRDGVIALRKIHGDRSTIRLERDSGGVDYIAENLIPAGTYVLPLERASLDLGTCNISDGALHLE